MASPPRIEIPGAIYHVTARGNRGQPIVLDYWDAEAVLWRLSPIVDRTGWRCLAYCVMTNHLHFLIELTEANLAAGMQTLLSSYARRFNQRHGFSGHLFRARYGARLVETDGHLLAATRYIFLNPFWAGMCERPEQYLWSSYAATVGLEPPPPFLDAERLLSRFHEDETKAQALIRTLVEDALTRSEP